MRVFSPSNRLSTVMAIFAAMVSLMAFGGELRAQSGTQDDTTEPEARQVVRTITNIAQAQWNFEGRVGTTTWNLFGRSGCLIL